MKSRAGHVKYATAATIKSTLADTTASPNLLLNPSFVYFSSKVFDPKFEVSPDTLHGVQNFMSGFAIIDSEENVRRSTLVSLLDEMTGQRFVQERTSANGKCIPDGVVLAFHDKIQIYSIVDEEKNKLGDGGSYPSVQALSLLFTHLKSEGKMIRH